MNFLNGFGRARLDRIGDGEEPGRSTFDGGEDNALTFGLTLRARFDEWF